MKTFLFTSILVSAALLQTSCDRSSNTSPSKSESKISLKLASSQALQLTNSESAFVNQISVSCPDYNQEFNLTEQEQSVIIYRTVADCDITLDSFTVTTDNARTYHVTDRTSAGGIVFDHALEAEILDSKIVTKQSQEEINCPETQDSSCDFKKVNIIFEYSELLSEQVSLINDLSITEIDLSIDKQPAPDCEINPEFKQNGYTAPWLEIDFSACTALLEEKVIEFDIYDSSVVDPTIENLHGLITLDLESFDANEDHKVILTIDDLKQLFNTTSINEALTKDFGIAIRNQGGISIRYYNVDNKCKIAEEICETAFALGEDNFIDMGVGTRWGWQATVLRDQPISYDIYAAAAQNDTSKGTLVGSVNYSFTEGALSVQIGITDADWRITESHVYAGVNDIENPAPGSYTKIHDNLDYVQFDSYNFSSSELGAIDQDALKVVTHLTVCKNQ